MKLKENNAILFANRSAAFLASGNPMLVCYCFSCCCRPNFCWWLVWNHMLFLLLQEFYLLAVGLPPLHTHTDTHTMHTPCTHTGETRCTDCNQPRPKICESSLQSSESTHGTQGVWPSVAACNKRLACVRVSFVCNVCDFWKKKRV